MTDKSYRINGYKLYSINYGNHEISSTATLYLEIEDTDNRKQDVIITPPEIPRLLKVLSDALDADFENKYPD